MSKKLNSYSDFKTDCDTKIALLVNSILFSILVSGKSDFFQLRPSRTTDAGWLLNERVSKSHLNYIFRYTAQYY